jgi:hypothetical protein
MKRNYFTNIALTLVGFLLLVNLVIMRSTPSRASSTIQYKFVPVQELEIRDLDKKAEEWLLPLNQNGSQGWEFVEIHGFTDVKSMNQKIFYLFVKK